MNYLYRQHLGSISDINHSRVLYDPPPRVLEIKARKNKWDLIKIKNKGNYKQGEKTAFRMGKIIANEATNKTLISKIYKHSCSSIPEK